MMKKAMILTMATIGLGTIASEACASLGDGQVVTFEVTASKLNVRTGAGTNNPIITKFSKGTKVYCANDSVEVLKNGWVKVTDGHYEGWVSMQYLKQIEEVHKEDLPLAGEYFGVTTANLNLRRGKGTNYSIKYTMPKGTKVDIINEQNGWLYVKTIHPKTKRVEFGYCSAKYVR